MLTKIRYFSLLLIVCGIAWGFHHMNRAELRYENDPCQQKLIFDQPQEVDFWATGGSRIMRSFITHEFSKALATSEHVPVVYDMSRSGRSEYHSYIFLRDFYAQGGKIKNVLLLYDEAPAARYHAFSFLIGKSSDILDLTITDPSLVWSRKIQDFLSLNIKRSSYHLENWIKGFAPKELTEDTRDCTLVEAGVEPHLIVDKYEKYDRSHSETLEWDIHSDDNQRIDALILKIIALASKHGTKVYLVVPPIFLHKALSDEFIRDAEDTLHATLITPDQATIDMLSQVQYFTDEKHMTPEAAAIHSRWLASEIRKHDSK